MKKWEIKSELKVQSFEFRIEQLVGALLKNRGIISEEEKKEFINPQLSSIAPNSLEIDQKQLVKAIKRVAKSIENKEEIIVYGDYDVDGITGAAIIWESLYKLGAKVLPYIPHRIDEGYGLSRKGIDGLLTHHPQTKLIITVDNGIVANDAVDYASEKGIDVIITDHHVASAALPKAHAIVHTTKLCGAAVGWIFTQEVIEAMGKRESWGDKTFHLELVTLATVADLVPLKGANRTLLKLGLEYLCKTNRTGLLALCREATIDPSKVGVYEIGHLIAPRLNAMGRLEYAMESLRLLCTTDKKRAESLANTLGSTNKERQQLTEEAWLHAASEIRSRKDIGKLLFIYNESYQQGVIGLVAGKLVEEFYRPAIVLSKGKILSKASARSVYGLNIIEFIRSTSDLLVDAGGHPMAAGFTVETAKLDLLKEKMEELANISVTDEMLIRTLRIDCEIPFSIITKSMFEEILKLSPFGMGNPEPTFVTTGVTIEDMRLVGKEGKHLKLKLSQKDTNMSAKPIFDAIAFGMGTGSQKFKVGDIVDVVYVIAEDSWNGNSKLQLKVKDIRAN